MVVMMVVVLPMDVGVVAVLRLVTTERVRPTIVE
jgi:hypothetical protein